MRIDWSAPAIADLQAARRFIARSNPSAARAQVLQVVAAVHGLPEFPGTGRRGRVPETRELVVGRTPYIVAYRQRAEVIEILRVLHGRQRWPDPG